MANALITGCITKARAGLADPKTFDKNIDELIDLAKEATADNPDAFNAKFINLLREAQENMKKDIISSEAQIASSIRARESFEESINAFRQQGKSPQLALAEATAAKGNNVVRMQQEAVELFSRDLDELSARFNKNMTAWVHDAKNEVPIMRELAELNNTVNPRVGVTGSKEAQAVAQVFQRNRVDPMRAELAENGIRVDQLESYMLRVSTDADTLADLGKEGFVKALVGRLKVASIFEGRTNVTEVEKVRFLENYFDGRIDGSIEEIPLSRMDLNRQRIAPIGKRMDRQRTLHLNTAEDYVWVMRNLGHNTVAGTMLQTISGVSRNLGLVREFGATPQNTVAHAKQVAKKGATDRQRRDIANPTAKQQLRGLDPDEILATVDGSRNYGGSFGLKGAVRIINNATRGALLGGVTLSAIPDLATASMAAARIGASAAQTIADRISVSTRGLSPEMKQRAAGIVTEANAYYLGRLQGSQMVEAGGIGVANNMSAKWVDLTMKWSMQNWWTRTGKGGAFVTYTRAVGDMLGTGFADLDASFRASLLRGGVTKDEWAALNTAGKKNLRFRDEASDFFDTDRIKDIDDAVIRKHIFKGTEASDRQVARAKAEITSHMKNAIRSFVDDSIVTPGVRERTALSGQVGDGTLMGALRAMTVNLLGYPTAYMMRAMGREMERPGASAITGIAMLSASSLVAGYASIALHDLAGGRTRDFASDDPSVQLRNFLEASARGGVGGHIGGMIASQIIYGDSPAGIAGGAPLSIIDGLFGGIMRAGGQFIDGEPDKATATLLKTIDPVIPFAGLPYTKFAADALVQGHVLEMFEPGAAAKKAKRFEDSVDGTQHKFSDLFN